MALVDKEDNVDYFFKTFFVVFFFVGSIMARAPLSQGGEILTLSEAIQIALRNNPDFKAKQAVVEAARGEKQKLSALLPSPPRVNAQIKTDRSFSNEGEYDFEIGGSQELEIGGQQFLRWQIGRLELEKTKKEYDWQKQRLIWEVKRAFYTVLYLQQKQGTLEKISTSNQELAQFATQRQNQGALDPFEGDLWRLDAATSFAELKGTQADLNEARLNLKRILGDDLVSVSRIEAPWPESFLLPSKNLLKERVIHPSLTKRPDLESLELEARQKAKIYSLAKRSLIPNPEVSFAYIKEKQIFPGLSATDKAYGVGVSIPIPLFSGKIGEITKAKSEQRMAIYQKEALEKQIAADVGNFGERLKIAKEIVDGYQKTGANLDNDLALLKEAFQKGNINTEAYLNKRDRLLKAKLGFIEARWVLAKSQFELELASGETSKEGQ